MRAPQFWKEEVPINLPKEMSGGRLGWGGRDGWGKKSQTSMDRGGASGVVKGEKGHG